MGEMDEQLATIMDENIKNRIKIHGYGQSVYHYTTINTLYGIITNKELWFGNTANMNDKDEICTLIKALQKVSETDSDISKVKCDEFFFKIHNRLTNEYPFAFCFTRLKDNAAQWDRYSDQAKGVCIAFNTKLIMKLVLSTHLLLFNKIFYLKENLQHELCDIIKKYITTGELDEFTNETGLIDNILASASLHKNDSFSTEEEIRAVTLWNRLIPYSKIEYMCVNNTIRKILKVSLEKLCEENQIDFEDIIDEIMLAPKTEQNIEELKSFLTYHGYENLANKVVISDCPLR